MKVTSKISKPKPIPLPAPTLESVTLELTPREAFLLTILIGATSLTERENTFKENYQQYAQEDYPDSAIGTAPSPDEAEYIANIYTKLNAVLKDAFYNGVR